MLHRLEMWFGTGRRLHGVSIPPLSLCGCVHIPEFPPSTGWPRANAKILCRRFACAQCSADQRIVCVPTAGSAGRYRIGEGSPPLGNLLDSTKLLHANALHTK